jgi:alcohol dehydrogenase YqhD (iron-dependent ADH family)
MVRAYRSSQSEVERRREAAERTRGMFAHLACGERLSDELIADRREEAAVEAREAAEEAQRLRDR